MISGAMGQSEDRDRSAGEASAGRDDEDDSWSDLSTDPGAQGPGHGTGAARRLSDAVSPVGGSRMLKIILFRVVSP